jgi:hypothetical protein
MAHISDKFQYLTTIVSNVQSQIDDKSAAYDLVFLTDAATITVDATLGYVFDVTLGGNRTLGNPTGGTDGQVIVFRIRQDAVGARTLTLDTKFVLGGIVITMSTLANLVDYITARYDIVNDKWHVIDFKAGY